MTATKPRKRGRKGEGSIFKRKDHDGKVIGYVAVLSLGVVNGRRKRRNFYGLTMKEVQDRMQVAREQQRNGTLPAGGRLTTAAWLRHWLEQFAKVRPGTWERYRGLVEKYMIPAFGSVPLEKLTPSHVQAMLNEHEQDLSPRSRHHLRAVLRTGLNRAIKNGLMLRNAAALTDPVPQVDREMEVFTPQQAAAFLEAVQDDDRAALYTLALATGMRQGEVLGLRWQDVDLEAGTLRVTKALQRIRGQWRLVEPKTRKSRRVVPLPAVAVDGLKTHRARQSAERLRKGERWLDSWGLVFTTEFGAPLSGAHVTRRFQSICQRADLPVLRFHDLRHSCASLLGALHVPARVVMELLGHSNINLTLNTYSHVFGSAQREAADAMDRALGRRSG